MARTIGRPCGLASGTECPKYSCRFIVEADHLDDLVAPGTWRQAARVLEVAVVSGLNILIGGGSQAETAALLPGSTYAEGRCWPLGTCVNH